MCAPRATFTTHASGRQELEAAAIDDARGLRREAEREHDQRGTREGVVELAPPDDPRRSVHRRAGVRRTTVTSQPNGPSRRSKLSVIPPPPRITTRAPSRLVPACPAPGARLGVRTEVAEPRQRQRQRVLGDRLGVDALPARPRAVGVRAHDVDVGLDARPRQLHPA